MTAAKNIAYDVEGQTMMFLFMMLWALCILIKVFARGMQVSAALLRSVGIKTK